MPFTDAFGRPETSANATDVNKLNTGITASAIDNFFTFFLPETKSVMMRDLPDICVAVLRKQLALTELMPKMR